MSCRPSKSDRHGPSPRLPPSPNSKHRSGAYEKEGALVTDRDDFLAWVKSTLYEAELAVHNGDAAPRRAIWSRNDP